MGVRAAFLAACLGLPSISAAGGDEEPRWFPGGGGSGWVSGTLGQTSTHFAGVHTDDGRLGIYYLCDPGGRRELMLAGPDATAGPWALLIDGSASAHLFQRTPEGLVTDVPPGGGVLVALRDGRALELLRPGGGLTGPVSLAGSGQALDEAFFGCG